MARPGQALMGRALMGRALTSPPVLQCLGLAKRAWPGLAKPGQPRSALDEVRGRCYTLSWPSLAWPGLARPGHSSHSQFAGEQSDTLGLLRLNDRKSYR